MLIRDLMSVDVQACHSYESLSAAAQKMWEADVGAVPVLDDKNRVVGMLTDRDICMAAYTQGRALSEIPVSTAMARQVVAVHTGELIEQAEHLMRDSQIRRLPVLDNDNRPVGIVSISDLARVAAGAHKSAVNRELVDTLAAICKPRADGQILALKKPIAVQAAV